MGAIGREFSSSTALSSTAFFTKGAVLLSYKNYYGSWDGYVVADIQTDGNTFSKIQISSYKSLTSYETNSQ